MEPQQQFFNVGMWLRLGVLVVERRKNAVVGKLINALIFNRRFIIFRRRHAEKLF